MTQNTSSPLTYFFLIILLCIHTFVFLRKLVSHSCFCHLLSNSVSRQLAHSSRKESNQTDFVVDARSPRFQLGHGVKQCECEVLVYKLQYKLYSKQHELMKQTYFYGEM